MEPLITGSFGRLAQERDQREHAAAQSANGNKEQHIVDGGDSDVEILEDAPTGSKTNGAEWDTEVSADADEEQENEEEVSSLRLSVPYSRHLSCTCAKF